jgi:hypothetical protein
MSASEKSVRASQDKAVSKVAYLIDLFVSTALQILEIGRDDEGLPERLVEGVVYRRLDPAYYAWLRAMLDLAAQATDQGKLSMPDYDILITKFDRIHRAAVREFGLSQLHEAMEELDLAGYKAPSQQTLAACEAAVYRFPVEGDFKASVPVRPSELALVDTIAERAVSLGWSRASLYQNRGNIAWSCGRDWGLVTHLRGGDRIGEVTSAAITIVGSAPGASPLKFYNPDQKTQQLNLFSTGDQR